MRTILVMLLALPFSSYKSRRSSALHHLLPLLCTGSPQWYDLQSIRQSWILFLFAEMGPGRPKYVLTDMELQRKIYACTYFFYIGKLGAMPDFGGCIPDLIDLWARARNNDCAPTLLPPLISEVFTQANISALRKKY